MKKSDVDVVVIGGGSAGLVAASGCAALGARTVLVERDRLGGECTWTGCVPSKALLHIARQAAQIRKAEELGIRTAGFHIDFQAVMESVRSTRRDVYEHGESPAYLKELGIRPLNASARFLDSHTVEIERDGRRKEISFRSAIVTTGSRPNIPDTPGIEAVDYLTTDTLFEIDRLPERLAILGGGAVAVEMAQAFASLGSLVTIVCRDDQLLPGTDTDAAGLLQHKLRDDGVQTALRSTITSISPNGDGLGIEVTGDGSSWRFRADRLLIAAGRVPNTGSLDLDAAGIHYDRHGIEVDEYCRTNVQHILASGDVTPAPNLTHVGEDMSKAAAINALARLPIWKYETSVIPFVVYTDPEVASVGKTAKELDAAGIGYDTIELPFDKIDRAVVEHDADGFIRIHHRFGKILGATIIGPQAGEMITEYAIAMKNGLRLSTLSSTVHPYPTMMLGTRRAADQFFFRSLKPWMVRGFQLLYGYRGDVPDYIGTRTIV